MALKLRAEQFHVLEEASRRALRQRIVAELRGRHPDPCASLGPALEGLADEGIHRAEALGLRAERDVGSFVEVMLLHGADFHQRPETAWMGEYLKDPAVAQPQERLRRLWAQLRRRERLRREGEAARRRFENGGR